MVENGQIGLLQNGPAQENESVMLLYFGLRFLVPVLAILLPAGSKNSALITRLAAPNWESKRSTVQEIATQPNLLADVQVQNAVVNL